MDLLRSYLDSTYLKTAKDAGISDAETLRLVNNCIKEAIAEKFKLAMIRPEYVANAKAQIVKAKSLVLVGTVIDFPLGNNTIQNKLQEAQTAIDNGADELDFVCNYQAFIKGEKDLLKQEILKCCELANKNHKTIKFIIEVAALDNDQTIQLCALIKNVVMANFKEEFYHQVFVKSSTGFFKTDKNQPNGATLSSIIIMLENASPLQIKASGGISSAKIASQFIQLGVKRIGTSSAKALILDKIADRNSY